MNVLSVVLTIISAAAGIISGLVLYNLTGIREAINRHTADISGIKDRLSNFRGECDDQYASKDDYIREAGYARRFQERQIADMAEIKTLVNKMPEMTGQIVRSIMAEVRRGD